LSVALHWDPIPEPDETDRLIDALWPAMNAWPEKRSPGAVAALENARLAVEEDPERIRLESQEREESLEVIKAMRLAPTLQVFEALLRDEEVPISELDPEWVKAYGLA
jgi:hypothetical protein